MSSLKEKMDQQFKHAMKARQEVVVSTLRLIRAAVKNKEIELRKTLDDAGIISVIQKLIKQTQESIEQFQKGKRDDLVKRAQEELSILKPYLPTLMSPADLEKNIRDIISKVGATSLKQMGDVMKVVSQNLAGKIDFLEKYNLNIEQKIPS